MNVPANRGSHDCYDDIERLVALLRHVRDHLHHTEIAEMPSCIEAIDTALADLDAGRPVQPFEFELP